ncbi:hypothetical protein ILYODFUR_029415 [Ilyodon furcidens]|uniref:Uncharacterized protein n=1 Tax=Ilyodon furcidens TaxID=33524 RepID=A0ABV0TMS2_9TELE
MYTFVCTPNALEAQKIALIFFIIMILNPGFFVRYKHYPHKALHYPHKEVLMLNQGEKNVLSQPGQNASPATDSLLSMSFFLHRLKRTGQVNPADEQWLHSH